MEIQRGQLAPGTRLRQSELAQRFGVSTTPVREALAFLQAEGLVRIDPHRGAIVFRPAAEDVRASFEIRIALEALAVELAVGRLDESQLNELQSLIDDMRRVEEPTEWVELNDRFHLMLYNAAGNPRLVEMIQSLRESSRYYIQLFVARHLRTHAADDEHQEILDAVRAGRTSNASKAMKRHLGRTARDVLALLEAESGLPEQVAV